MKTPPPLPIGDGKKPLNPKPIKRAEFMEKKGFRAGNVTFDYSLIVASQRKAEEWINNQPAIEIVQIQTFHSTLHGITVVWYHES